MLRLSVELPAVPVQRGRRSEGSPSRGARGWDCTSSAETPDPLEAWWRVAVAAAHGGAGTIWFTGGPGWPTGGEDGSRDRSPPTCDPCTLAAAAISRVPGIRLGVMSTVPAGRHPAVLAREITTIDVMSEGRAAVLVRQVPDEAEEGRGMAWERLAEAAWVCRSVLRDPDPVFEGRFLHVAGAVNRPPPWQRSVPVVTQLPSGSRLLDRVGRASGAREGSRMVLAASTALVCGDAPGEVASWRAALDDAVAAGETGPHDAPTGSPRGPAAAPMLLCRTTLQPAGAAGPRGGPARTEALRAAGADGVILRVPVTRRADAALRAGPGELDASTREIRRAFAPWADEAW